MFGFAFDPLGDVLGKLVTIDRQRRSGGHARRRRSLHHQRAGAAQFFLQ